MHRRFEPNAANELFLSERETSFPVLVVSLRDDLACMHFFPQEGHPGFQSIGTRRFGSFTFYGTDKQPFEIPAEAVISFDEAFRAAVEFCVTLALPQTLRWFEL